MSDKLLSVVISIGILAALTLWVPTLVLCERLILKYGKHRKAKQTSVRQLDNRRKSAAI